MSWHFISDDSFGRFVDSLLAVVPVIAPVAKTKKSAKNGKNDRFVFAELRSAGELRLDYDVSALPPKAAFFPPQQTLVRFNAQGPLPEERARKRVLLGVHVYDLKAIDELDQLFASGVPDSVYLRERQATVIVGSSVQTPAPRAFWGSWLGDKPAAAQDGFLTRVPGGYVYEAGTDEGRRLLAFGEFRSANDGEIETARKVNDDARASCEQVVSRRQTEVAVKARAAFPELALFEEQARECFSCGACNLVCPTCYCFDVQDRWNLDQVSGERVRKWDGCLLEDFSKVSLGGGKHENFRERRAERYRHRMMRKLAYLNAQLGAAACVGCGRCATACVPDIADPVHFIRRLFQ